MDRMSGKMMRVIALTIFVVLAGSIPADFTYAEKTDAGEVSVIFTHDMHSHMDADKAEKNGEIVRVGGFAKLKTAMDGVLSEYPDSFILDAGDFSMGTPYQTVFSQEASELKMMEVLGIEAATLGNHEFDYRAEGLTSMLEAAKGVDVEFVASNIDWEAAFADKALEEDARALKAACDAYGIKEYAVIEHDGVKAAVFGLMGENAVEYAPESGLFFEAAKTAAVNVVEQIKDEADADMIICLSHCGTQEDEADVMEETEDYLLAEAVPDIDLIISGHSHTVLEEPVQVGDTYIVSCGSYNAYMGHAVLESDGADRYRMTSYELVPLDETVEGDAAVDAALEQYKALVNESYFSDYGYAVDQVIAHNEVGFSAIEEFGLVQGEEPLGDLIADSYQYAIRQTGEDVEMTVVPHGVIRGSFFKGDVTVGDAFNVSSLGSGRDGLPGYPLVKAYLTGKELKAIAEVDASISNFMGVARLYCSGLEYGWNPNRLILNRAVDVSYNDGSGPVPVEDERLYSIAADLYSCQMLGSVKDQSFGLLKIEPKDADGNVIEDFEEHIIYDGNRELKAWYALASYIDSFEGDQIPAYYSETHDRKVLIDSKSPAELLRQPNHIFWLVASVAAVLVLMAAGIVLLVRRRVKRRKDSKNV